MNTANSAWHGTHTMLVIAHGQNSVALNNSPRNWKMNRCYDISLLTALPECDCRASEELEVGAMDMDDRTSIPSGGGGGLISHAIKVGEAR